MPYVADDIGDSNLAYYRALYRAQNDSADHFLRWEVHMAHAVQLEAEPGRIFEEYGDLTGRQLGEGARIAARRYALLIAEVPAHDAALVVLKAEIAEAIERDVDEVRRSYVLRLLQASLIRDTERLDIDIAMVACVAPSALKH
ncbi:MULTISPECIES: hypothetical protein [Hyphomicrobiales]|uniref:hypothetical protein n=1 Tax=Methylobacterium sp. CCH7-A2 TaxID=1768789 RepID=UPI00082C6E23|nr:MULTISPECIES: hypothetical protein [Hyphomicrobiales]